MSFSKGDVIELLVSDNKLRAGDRFQLEFDSSNGGYIDTREPSPIRGMFVSKFKLFRVSSLDRFDTFEKVLVRDFDNDSWMLEHYAYKLNDKHFTFSQSIDDVREVLGDNPQRSNLKLTRWEQVRKVRDVTPKQICELLGVDEFVFQGELIKEGE